MTASTVGVHKNDDLFYW